MGGELAGTGSERHQPGKMPFPPRATITNLGGDSGWYESLYVTAGGMLHWHPVLCIIKGSHRLNHNAAVRSSVCLDGENLIGIAVALPGLKTGAGASRRSGSTSTNELDRGIGNRVY